MHWSYLYFSSRARYHGNAWDMIYDIRQSKVEISFLLVQINQQSVRSLCFILN